MAQKKKGNMPIKHIVFFILYLLLIWFDGGLCLALGAGIGRTASIILCILLSGVPILLAGSFLHQGKTKLSILLFSFSGVFTVFVGCLIRTGNSASSIISINLLIQSVCIGITLLFIAGMNHGNSVKGCKNFLLICGIVSVIVSLYLSTLRYSPFKKMQFVGFEYWTRAFACTNPIDGLLQYHGSLGLIEGGNCSSLSLYPLSSAFCIFLLRASLGLINDSQLCDTDEYQYLTSYKAEHPEINRISVESGNYEYLNAYKMNCRGGK